MSASLRPEEVAALVAELSPVLVGGRLEKVYDRPPHAFLLRFRTPSGKRSVWVSTRPGVSRLHLVDEPGVSPPSPSPAATELRTLLGGVRVVAVDQPGNDRLIRIRCARGPAERPKETIDLVLELFGRSGRLVAVDGTSRRVRFRHGRGGVSTGERYRFPEPPERSPDDRWTLPFEPRSLVPDDLLDHETPFHRFVEIRMREEEARRDRVARRQAVLARLRREGKRRRGLAAKLERERAEAERWETWQRWGELLKGNLATIRRGATSVEVPNWYEEGAPAIEIALDPAVSPLENVERCFRRARKGKRALGTLTERLATLASEIAEIETTERAITESAPDDVGTEAAALEAAEAWLAHSGRRPRPRREGGDRGKSAPASRGPRRYRTREGLEVLAGRNARENDELSIRTARGNDLFFHRSDRPGPHVILRVPRGGTASPESIDDAAYLAAYLSGWRGPSDATVVWTEAKYVTKPKGLPPGKVLVQRTRDHRVDFEEGRIGTLAVPDEADEGAKDGSGAP